MNSADLVVGESYAYAIHMWAYYRSEAEPVELVDPSVPGKEGHALVRGVDGELKAVRRSKLYSTWQEMLDRDVEREQGQRLNQAVGRELEKLVTRAGAKKSDYVVSVRSKRPTVLRVIGVANMTALLEAYLEGEPLDPPAGTSGKVDPWRDWLSDMDLGDVWVVRHGNGRPDWEWTFELPLPLAKAMLGAVIDPAARRAARVTAGAVLSRRLQIARI